MAKISQISALRQSVCQTSGSSLHHDDEESTREAKPTSPTPRKDSIAPMRPANQSATRSCRTKTAAADLERNIALNKVGCPLHKKLSNSFKDDSKQGPAESHCFVCLFVTRGPGDSKLLCGPTTVIEGKERCDRLF